MKGTILTNKSTFESIFGLVSSFECASEILGLCRLSEREDRGRWLSSGMHRVVCCVCCRVPTHYALSLPHSIAFLYDSPSSASSGLLFSRLQCYVAENRLSSCGSQKENSSCGALSVSLNYLDMDLV